MTWVFFETAVSIRAKYTRFFNSVACDHKLIESKECFRFASHKKRSSDKFRSAKLYNRVLLETMSKLPCSSQVRVCRPYCWSEPEMTCYFNGAKILPLILTISLHERLGHDGEKLHSNRAFLFEAFVAVRSLSVSRQNFPV